MEFTALHKHYEQVKKSDSQLDITSTKRALTEIWKSVNDSSEE